MHNQVHLMIVTSLSMIITFALHCIMERIPVRQSCLQLYWINFFRDFGLTIRCVYNQGISMHHFRIILLFICSHFFREYNMYLLFH
jgi:hypothetical protein